MGGVGGGPSRTFGFMPVLARGSVRRPSGPSWGEKPVALNLEAWWTITPPSLYSRQNRSSGVAQGYSDHLASTGEDDSAKALILCLTLSPLHPGTGDPDRQFPTRTVKTGHMEIRVVTYWDPPRRGWDCEAAAISGVPIATSHSGFPSRTLLVLKSSEASTVCAGVVHVIPVRSKNMPVHRREQ